MSAQLIDFPSRPGPALPANRVCPAPARGPEPARVRTLRAAIAMPVAAPAGAADRAARVVAAFEALPLAEAAVFSVRTLTGGRLVGVSYPGWRDALSPVEARIVADRLFAQPFGPGAFVLANDLLAVAFEVEAHAPVAPTAPTPSLWRAALRALTGPHVTGLGFLIGLTLLTLSAMALAAWPDVA